MVTLDLIVLEKDNNVCNLFYFMIQDKNYTLI